MELQAILSDTPIETVAWPEPPAGTDGAVLEFSGIVRGSENGEPIRALVYEAYRTMAVSEMEKIIRRLGRQFPCSRVDVCHRLGIVPVGGAAIRIRICSAHRGEGIGFLSAFMDALKKDVPIWKAGVER